MLRKLYVSVVPITENMIHAYMYSRYIREVHPVHKHVLRRFLKYLAKAKAGPFI